MRIHLIDGTYELFRHYYAVPSARDKDGREVGAVRGVLASLLGMMNEGVTHIAVATDHVIESFRNNLWAGYKTGEGVPPDLLEQFPLLEEVLAAAGLTVWPMVEFEADDALAAAAAKAAARPARGAGRHLHARQGSRPIRARNSCGSTQSPHARHLATKPAWSISSACRPHPFPTIWPSWAMSPTVIPA